jgi:thiamine kinase-like enzyme
MNAIFQSFGLNPSDFTVERIGTGHIHQTYKLNGKSSFVLQRVNKNVFKQPEIIATNLRLASEQLKRNFPDYPFLRSIPSIDQSEMVYDAEGFPWRLYPYLQNTITVDKVEIPAEALSAASEFGRLTCCLDKADVNQFKESIPQFHDLGLRYRQFEEALSRATDDRIQKGEECVNSCKRSYHLVEKYFRLIQGGSLRLRITHNDTKINNILFDEVSRKAVCVIDLDTLMPGYFIYDLGDMVRTFVSPVSEEESDFSKITFREGIYESLVRGYLAQMEMVMSPVELKAIPFAGKMMTYIMALRFLSDYLNGDIYYQTSYPGQNLVRAGNQLRFLEKLEAGLPEAN